MLSKNNYFIKVFGIAALAVSIISAGGCKKSFLNPPVQGALPAVQLYTTATGAAQGINGIYANLGAWAQTAFPALAIESMGGDEVQKGSTPGDSPNMGVYHNFTQTGAESGFDDTFWNGQYASISLCNQAIDSIPKISMDASLKARYVAEAKFVRAYNYFRLARAYGDVPLRLHYPKTAADFNLARTARAQVYAQVEQDLTDAAAVLPQTYSGLDIGRATKGAALALHAKVAMYQAKWSNVLTYTNAVIAEGTYSLFPDFEKSFREANENNPEEIFEIQNANTQSNSAASTSQYSQVQGVAPTYGWGFNIPTHALVAAFEPGDPRLNGTILFAGGTSAEGDAIPALGNGHVDSMYNYKSYVPFSDPILNGNPGAGQDVRVIRYADVLLMNAEAANETGNTTLALSSLELVRARARGGNTAVLPKVTTTDQATLRLAIWHERQVELAMESDRFFDVIRQGRGAALFGNRGFKTGKNELQPIPTSEIVLSGGLLKQNPGY
ncbi:MAG: RagB/SusD family nutrient uptake outer membrane protein [Mucilaginibacter sp.]|nr:RagB/SusD family nutrient uptake outer membrane protein [Mucilaginibacter sp.]